MNANSNPKNVHLGQNFFATFGAKSKLKGCLLLFSGVKMEEAIVDQVFIQAHVFAYAKVKPTDLTELSDGGKYLEKLAFGKDIYMSRAPFWCDYDSWTKEESAYLLSGMLPPIGSREFNFGELYWTDIWMSATSPTRPILIFKIFADNFICLKHVREILGRSTIGDRAHPREWVAYAKAKGLLPHTSMIDIDNSPLLSLLEPSDAPVLLSPSDTEPTSQSKSKLPYSTPWLSIIDAAIAHFYNPRREHDPKSYVVVDWILSKAERAGLERSQKIAEAIFTMIKSKHHNPKK